MKRNVRLPDMRISEKWSTGGSGSIVCPHWIGQSQHEIHCRWIEDEQHIILRCRNSEDKKRQERIFCRTQWYRNCEICRMIEQYDDD